MDRMKIDVQYGNHFVEPLKIKGGATSVQGHQIANYNQIVTHVLKLNRKTFDCYKSLIYGLHMAKYYLRNF